MTKLSAFILFFILYCNAFSQVQFQRITAAEGLSQSSVITIDQDALGFMWFGTRDGLNKYDGEKIVVYRHNEDNNFSISNNDILDLVPAANGDMWIGTYDGLNHYDASSGTFTVYQNHTDSNSISNNTIWSVLVDEKHIWAGTASGLNRLNLITGKFQTFEHDSEDSRSLSGNRITELFKDRNGNIWVGTNHGLNKIIYQDSLNIYCQRITPDIAGIPENNLLIQVISQNQQGQILIGTKQHGLIIYDQENEQWKHYQSGKQNYSLLHNDVRAITIDRLGRTWVGTYQGINIIAASGEIEDIQHEPENVNSLGKSSVKSLFQDKHGSVWVGTYYGGVNMWNKANFNFTNITQLSNKFGLNYNVVSSISEYEEYLILGTEGGGINFINKKDKTYHYLTKDNSLLPSNNIKTLYLKDNHLFIGTYNAGFCIYDLKDKRFLTFVDQSSGFTSNSIYDIVHYEGNQYWIATFTHGISLWNIKTDEIRSFTETTANNQLITDNQVRNLLVDKNLNLWIGTQSGINFLSREKIANRNYKFEQFLYNAEEGTGDDVITIYQDSQSNIWCGSKENGLHKFENGLFTRIDLFSGIENSSNTIHAIEEDDLGNLWLSSNNGLIKFNPYAEEIKIFQVGDGLLSNEFNNNAVYKSSEGILYFGSPFGVSSFKPDAIQTNTVVPEVVLTNLSINGERVHAETDNILKATLPFTDQITLEYNQANFTLNFTLPNFINPDKNQYAYKLVGLEDEWNYTLDGQANYTIQNKGNYTLLVKGANNDGIWSEPVVLDITVKPSPWRSGWAFAGYGSAIVIALILWLRIVQSRARIQHNLELTQKQKEQDMQLSQMKLQFFTNISHDFRTPLTLIIGPLSQILEEFRGSNKMYKQLKSVYHNAEHLLRLINQLMDFRKLENKQIKLQAAEGNIVKFCKEIYLSFRQYAEAANYSYHFFTSDEEIRAYYDRDKMEKVLYNIISNAFKYTPEGGEVNIVVNQLPNEVNIVISDSGIGISKKYVERVFDRFYQVSDKSNSEVKRGTGIGLALSKGIIDLHKGRIEVVSEEGRGSKFVIHLPLGSNHLQPHEIIHDFQDSEALRDYQMQWQEIEKDLIDKLPEAAASKDKTILIVEDNAQIRNFINTIFKDTYNIIEAENGKEGLKLAISEMPDIIISDIMMPKMDGIEFCEKIKSEIKTSHIPVILLTARTSLIFKMEGLESGADDYINKPFNVKELMLKVRNHIHRMEQLREKFNTSKNIVPSEVTFSSIDEELLQKAIAVVEKNIGNEFFDIPLFCEELGVSRTMLFSKIKAWTEMTPNEFIQSMRMKRAAQLLEQNKLSVSQICYKVGYKNPKYFSRSFQKHFKLTPSQYLEKFKNDLLES